MDPISAAIIAALVAGATTGLTETAKKAIDNIYEALKAKIKEKFGKDNDLTNAVSGVEAKPTSDGRKAILQEEVKAAKADHDQELLSLAKKVMETIQQQGIEPGVIVAVRDGAAAIGNNAKAVGKDANIIEGSVQGDFIARGGKKNRK